MGYYTQFHGKFSFTSKLAADQLDTIKQILINGDEDHFDEKSPDTIRLYLILSEDGTGIVWDGNDYAKDMDYQLNFIISEMRKQWPDFGLTGNFIVQGEELLDRWLLYIGDEGLPRWQQLVVYENPIHCPYCHNSFALMVGAPAEEAG